MRRQSPPPSPDTRGLLDEKPIRTPLSRGNSGGGQSTAGLGAGYYGVPVETPGGLPVARPASRIRLGVVPKKAPIQPITGRLDVP